MPLRVRNVAQIVDQTIHVTANPPRDFVLTLSRCESAEGSDGPRWTVDLVIGDGITARSVVVQLNPFLSKADYETSLCQPVFVGLKAVPSKHPAQCFLLFQDRFFIPDRLPNGSSEVEEIILRTKRAVYEENEQIRSLRAYVSNVEATLEFKKSGPNRDSIPDDVKLLVWSRDGGACVRCGSKERLHFDHIIPVSKGGGNDPKNIQILCEGCNLKKSDKIAF